MKQKGTLTTWNDAKGFGFITPEGGGDRIFAHISSYAGRGRPASNRMVAYSVARDGNGRLRAGQFRYVGAARMDASIAPGVWVATALVSMFFAALAGLYYRNILPISVPGAYFAVSLIVFVMYWIDKRAATRGAQRTPEKTLHLLELSCGWPGALLAQQVFRHKTRKASYQLVFWLAVLLNLGALGWTMIAPQAMTLRHQMGFGML